MVLSTVPLAPLNESEALPCLFFCTSRCGRGRWVLHRVACRREASASLNSPRDLMSGTTAKSRGGDYVRELNGRHSPARRNGGLFVCFLPAGNTPSHEEAD